MTQTDHSVPVRRGLGRGLGSLIPTLATGGDEPPTGPLPDTEPTSVLGAWFAEVPVDAIVPNPRPPRQVFDEEAMAELVHSGREVGRLQPVVVRPTGPGSYELVMGERRWRACREVGMTVVPAIVRHTQDDAMLRDGLLENLHRFGVYTLLTSTGGWDTGRAVTNSLAIVLLGPAVLATLRRASRRASYGDPAERSRVRGPGTG